MSEGVRVSVFYVFGYSFSSEMTKNFATHPSFVLLSVLWQLLRAPLWGRNPNSSILGKTHWQTEDRQPQLPPLLV